ncbi:hypothetical protein AAFF_G00047660 [Aldrovandia affinis]|uniref:Uncharacterized protein n=1 Tax=Aldrovandia affinis TaxID=143900 RepID=A0AAD7S1R1_9TELE|nr:hypothetical protein AAFF_G00047660 [Aldrovandia affinis]
MTCKVNEIRSLYEPLLLLQHLGMFHVTHWPSSALSADMARMLLLSALSGFATFRKKSLRMHVMNAGHNVDQGAAVFLGAGMKEPNSLSRRCRDQETKPGIARTRLAVEVAAQVCTTGVSRLSKDWPMAQRRGGHWQTAEVSRDKGSAFPDPQSNSA